MKVNHKGFTEVAILVSVIIGLVAFFVPNPISQSVGVGVRPNKTIQKQVSRERVELLKDDKGNVIATKTYTDDSASDVDERDTLSLWEQFRALPGLFIIFIIAGVLGFGPGLVVIKVLWAKFVAWKNKHDELEEETKTIIRSVDEAFATISMTIAGEALPGEIDRVALTKRITDNMLKVLSTKYDQSTKDLVKELRNA